MKLHDEYETLVVFALNTTETWSNTPRSVQIHRGTDLVKYTKVSSNTPRHRQGVFDQVKVYLIFKLTEI